MSHKHNTKYKHCVTHIFLKTQAVDITVCCKCVDTPSHPPIQWFLFNYLIICKDDICRWLYRSLCCLYIHYDFISGITNIFSLQRCKFTPIT